MDLITSTANPRIKQIRKLRERKEREASGLFFIEGLRIVGEAVQQGAEIETLVVAPDLLTSDFGRDQVAHQRQLQTPILETSADVFQSCSQKDGPQGLAAVLRQRWTPLDADLARQPQLWVALDQVADPGNLGTIMRTLDAVGGAGIILLDHSTDPYDPSALRASMGAVFSLRLARASLAEFAAWKEQTGMPLVGTSGAAQHDYHFYRYPELPLTVLMGSERQGLQPQHLALCDDVVAIPMAGSSDSLNLAVATAVVLYEIYNQRRA